MSLFENTLVHVSFLCDSSGVFIIPREKRVCKESGTLVFISFPSRASSCPRLSRGLPAKRGARGVIGKRGVNFVQEGVLGLFLVVAFCAYFYQHDQEYIVKGDVFCSFDYLSWDGA